MTIINNIVRKLGDLGFFLAVLIMAFLAISITWEVVSRYVLGLSTTWVTEVSGYLVSGVLFLAIGKVYRQNGHVNMSLLIDKMNDRNSMILGFIIDLCVLVFALFVFDATFDMALLSYQLNWKSSTILAFPLYLPQALMPLGCFILILEVVNIIFQKLVGVLTHGTAKGVGK